MNNPGEVPSKLPMAMGDWDDLVKVFDKNRAIF